MVRFHFCHYFHHSTIKSAHCHLPRENQLSVPSSSRFGKQACQTGYEDNFGPFSSRIRQYALASTKTSKSKIRYFDLPISGKSHSSDECYCCCSFVWPRDRHAVVLKLSEIKIITGQTSIFAQKTKQPLSLSRKLFCSGSTAKGHLLLAKKWHGLSSRGICSKSSQQFLLIIRYKRVVQTLTVRKTTKGHITLLKPCIRTSDQ